MNRFTRVFALMPLVAAACTTAGGDYPSLALRPAERVSGTFEPVAATPPPAAPVSPSPDLVARLADLRRQAEAAHAEFREAAPGADRLAAAAGGTGSDSWAAAQIALADLDSIRSRAAVALADLDTLWVDSTLEAGPRDAVGAARDAVETLIAEEDAVLARLRGRI